MNTFLIARVVRAANTAAGRLGALWQDWRRTCSQLSFAYLGRQILQGKDGKQQKRHFGF